jgi:hypothetical protein
MLQKKDWQREPLNKAAANLNEKHEMMTHHQEYEEYCL